MAKRYGVCLVLAGLFGTLAAQTEPSGPKSGPKFEVASVKPAAGNDLPGRSMGWRMREILPPGNIPTVDRGRVRIRNWTLLDVIAAAYRVRATRVSGPGWLSGQAFDIEAKVPEDAPQGQVNEMLPALLEERFGLRLHRESKNQSGYALVVGKNGSKLKPADPDAGAPKDLSAEDLQARSKEQMTATMAAMKEAMKNGTLRPGASHSSYKGITTVQLATNLSRFVEGPVVDMTELTGKYDVVLDTSQDTPDEPGVTIFDAIEKLGLKLESRKVTIDTLVIDQIAKTPTAN
jgi:uncharacterized protein (TIGR03435 family)